MELGVELGYRLPLFDVSVTAEKQSPYSRMSQNEMALQFYSAGFFDPQAAQQALACLDMMEFDRKGFVMEKIAENGQLYQQRQALAQMGALLPEMEEPVQRAGTSRQKNVSGGEAAVTRQARQRVAQSGRPR